MSRLLRLIALGLLPSLAAAETVVVSDELPINVRRGPSTDYAIIAAVRSGAVLEVLERQPGYVRVRTPKDNEGWVLERFVQTEPVARQRVDGLEASLSQARAEAAELRESRAQALTDLARAESALQRAQARQDELRQALEQARAAPLPAPPTRVAAAPAPAPAPQNLPVPVIALEGSPLGLGLALIALLLAALTALRWRRFRREEAGRRSLAAQAQLDFAAAAEAAVGDLRQSIGGLAGLVQGAQRRLAQLERQGQALDHSEDPLSGGAERLPEAIALARDGIAPLDIMQRCGLSLAEARLLAAIHAGPGPARSVP